MIYIMVYATTLEDVVTRVNRERLKLVQIVPGSERGFWAIIEIGDKDKLDSLKRHAAEQRPQWTIKECV